MKQPILHVAYIAPSSPPSNPSHQLNPRFEYSAIVHKYGKKKKIQIVQDNILPPLHPLPKKKNKKKINSLLQGAIDLRLNIACVEQ